MGIFGTIGGALKGIGSVAAPVVGGLVGGPLGAAAGSALGGLIGGGGGGGGGAGLSPAAISALGAAQIAEQRRARESAEAAANARNQLLTRNLGLAEQTFSDKGPLRDLGLGTITDFLGGGGGRGIFQPNAPGMAGDISGFDLPSSPGQGIASNIGNLIGKDNLLFSGGTGAAVPPKAKLPETPIPIRKKTKKRKRDRERERGDLTRDDQSGDVVARVQAARREAMPGGIFPLRNPGAFKDKDREEKLF